MSTSVCFVVRCWELYIIRYIHMLLIICFTVCEDIVMSLLGTLWRVWEVARARNDSKLVSGPGCQALVIIPRQTASTPVH